MSNIVINPNDDIISISRWNIDFIVNENEKEIWTHTHFFNKMKFYEKKNKSNKLK